MQNRGRTLVSVVFLVIGAVFLAAGLIFWVGSAGGGTGFFGMGSAEKEAYCVVEYLGSEEIGSSYEGVQADEGYSFYELRFSVRNEGNREAYREMPYLYYKGENYDDVHDYWDTPEEPEEEEVLFAGYYEPCLPPGRTGTASQVVQVKDGVSKFTAVYAPNYDSADTEMGIVLS